MPTQTLWTVIGFNSLVMVFAIMVLALRWRPQWWPTMLTLFAGMLIGFLEPRTEEIIFIVFLLIAFGFFAGFAQPRHAWRWAILLAVWVPLNEAFAMTIGARTVAQPNLLASFFAFVPAFVGTYAGVLVHQLSHTARTEPSA